MNSTCRSISRTRRSSFPYALAVVISLLLTTTLQAQNHLVNPESAVYDVTFSRTLVSNTGNGNLIYRVHLPELSLTEFVGSGITAPNGLFYDGEQERLLLVSFRGHSPVQAIALADSTVSTVITTDFDNLDGIARDNQGRFYISSWGTS